MLRPEATQLGGLAIRTSRIFAIIPYGLLQRGCGLEPVRQGSESGSETKESSMSVLFRPRITKTKATKTKTRQVRRESGATRSQNIQTAGATCLQI